MSLNGMGWISQVLHSQLNQLTMLTLTTDKCLLIGMQIGKILNFMLDYFYFLNHLQHTSDDKIVF